MKESPVIRKNKNQWLMQLLATKLPTGKYHALRKNLSSCSLEEMLLVAQEVLTEEDIWQMWQKDYSG